MTGGVTQIGNLIVAMTLGSGYALRLLGRSLQRPGEVLRKRREILRQAFTCAIESLPVTLVVAVFSGFILALSSGIELQKYGQAQVVGSLVAVVMCREFAPFMTGLICAANVGSAMAAELGTMKVSEEVDALEVMSIDPTRFLVMPRVVAMTIACPLLTVLADAVGIIGGGVIGATQLNVSWTVYYKEALDVLDLKEIYTGLFKAMVFGMIIAVVACAQGLRAENGATGVGQAVRASVIVSFLLIIITGFYGTKVFFGG